MPLRTFVVAGSNHPHHLVATRALHKYLRWRNANARHPTSWPLNAANELASAANANTGGAKPLPTQPDPKPGQRFRSEH